MMSRLPAQLRASVPVDAQGVTEAIDHLAAAAGLSPDERRGLIRPHAVNPEEAFDSKRTKDESRIFKIISG